jgi:DNA-binding Xre family transcriptional regulator
MAMMSGSVIATADQLLESSIDVDCATRTSLVDVWIGSRVRIRRTSRGIGQRDFSKLLGIDQNDLAAFETGKQRIRANLLFRIAKSLDVRPDYFFQGFVEERPEAV